jgi:hypothetical protein
MSEENFKMTVVVEKYKIFMNIDYMNGKFTIEKTFPNDYLGKEELESIKKQLNSESKIRKYLGLE